MNNYITPGIDVESLSVLVVDDVPLNILLIKKMLSQYTFEIRTANGGQAIWNGRTQSGERVASGVYYVFASDAQGNNRSVAKILIVR